MSYQRWIGVGNLGADAELRYTSGGMAVANFRMACTEVWKDKDGAKQERTEWVRISYWGKGAEGVAQYLVKGKQVLVEGKLNTRKWQDKDGNDRYSTEIKADQVRLLGGGGGGRRRARDEDEAEEPSREAGGGGFEDDAPF